MNRQKRLGRLSCEAGDYEENRSSSRLALAPRAAEVRVTSDPPLPVANLLQNPDVEQGRMAQPDAWRFSTARPDNFEIGCGWRALGQVLCECARRAR